MEDIFAVGDRPPPGIIGDPRNRPPHRHYNRCSRWPVGWDTRCGRSLDSPMPQDSRREIDHSLIRTGDSVLRHGPVGTTPGSSALAADNSDICRPAVHSRTLHYHLSQRVGTFSPTVVNSGMAITNRETPHRPGSHPHRSVRTSFDPHFIFMHQIVFTLFTTGHGGHRITSIYRQSTSCTETCASSADRDHTGSQEVSSHNVRDGTSASRTALQSVPLDQNQPGPVTQPVGRSVDWSRSVDDQLEKEAVMQISGAGHWFLEGWIGDHSVDFLVDSGSAVTAVSCSFIGL